MDYLETACGQGADLGMGSEAGGPTSLDSSASKPLRPEHRAGFTGLCYRVDHAQIRARIHCRNCGKAVGYCPSCGEPTVWQFGAIAPDAALPIITRHVCHECQSTHEVIGTHFDYEVQ